MASDYNYNGFDNTLGQAENGRSARGKSCLSVGLLLILVGSLLISSIYSAFWLFTRDQTPNATPTPTLTPEAMVAESDSARSVTPTAEGTEITAVAEPTAPLPPITNNRIVFINNDNQIETVAPDGNNQQTLTDADDIFFQFPAWSPDGSQIAAIGGKFSGGGVFTLTDSPIEDEESSLRELYFSSPANPFYLYWAPDSQQISFLANKPGAGLGLNLMDVADSASNRVIATGSPVYWNWTQNSSQMLLHAGEENAARLVLIDQEGRDMAPEIPSPGLFQTPGISRNGRYWAFSQLKGGNASWLVIQDKQTGTRHEERHAGAIAMSWSPNANKLAFISGNANETNSAWGPLRLHDTETGLTRLLSSDLVLAFFWSPNGEKIALITAQTAQGFDNEQQVYNDKKQRLTKINSAKTNVVQINPHQFNLSVIDVSSGVGLQLAEIVPSITFISQFLPFFDQYALSHRLWSPNSDALVLPIVEDHKNQIVVISASGGKTTPIGSGDIAFWSQN